MSFKYKYMFALQILITLNSAFIVKGALNPLEKLVTSYSDIEDVKNAASPKSVVAKIENGIKYLSSTIEKLIKGPDPILSTAKFLLEGVEQYQNEPNDEPNSLESYDYIIVGAGTAGCVIANRLTELADMNVLLIEAGSHESIIMDIPYLLYFLQQSHVDWQYKTTPSDKYCTGFKNNECNWPRGKVMGGSSVLNNLIYQRGSPYNFNSWLQEGNTGWGWEDVLPYFKKLESCNVPDADLLYRNSNGPVSVEYSPYKTIVGEAWIQAAEEYGWTFGDYNGESRCGVSRLQLSLKNGSRDSSSRAYLHPIHNRNNLHVVQESFVTKILFSGTVATGVTFERRGIVYTIKARKEVIISAGAINSPQLLMLSGLGPKKHLEEIGIPLIKDLPVGNNLMDHICSPITFLVNHTATEMTTKAVIKNFTTIFEYFQYHTGVLSSPGQEAVVFMESADKFNKTGWPDLEILMTAVGLNADPVYKRIMGIPDALYEEVYGPLGDNATILVVPVLLRPKSRGNITLKNSDPFTHPNINPNYFYEKEDMDKLVEGIRIAIDITTKPSMLNVGAKLYQVPIKACLDVGVFGSDEYWACHTRTFSTSIYHFSGTCKMGPADDPTAVVDSRLRVHGMQRLRVVDASIFPSIISGHINIPTYMVAEKAADMIKADLGF